MAYIMFRSMEVLILTVQRRMKLLLSKLIDIETLTTIVNDLYQDLCEFLAKNACNEPIRAQQCPQKKNYTDEEKDIMRREVRENLPIRRPVAQSEKTKPENEEEAFTPSNISPSSCDNNVKIRYPSEFLLNCRQRSPFSTKFPGCLPKYVNSNEVPMRRNNPESFTPSNISLSSCDTNGLKIRYTREFLLSCHPRSPFSELAKYVNSNEVPLRQNDPENNLNIGTTVGQGSGVTPTTSPLNSNLCCRPDDPPVVSSQLLRENLRSVNSVLNSNYGDLDSTERIAKLYRSSAVFSEADCIWSGSLPPRAHENPTYSCKVFLGGIPWDINEAQLIYAFARFGPIEIVWPRKVGRSASRPSNAGHNYIIFESEEKVKALLQACTYSNSGNWYFKLSSRRWTSKQVQIIPWVISDSNCVLCPYEKLDSSKTVFVGALHGMLTAEGLALVMNELFGGVVYAVIDTDIHKYPTGSGLVAFNNHKSYMKAISAAFIEIKTPGFKKKVQCDPYIEKAMCSSCQVQEGPIFCRDAACLQYFCRSCWQWRHAVDTYLSHHKPMMRNKRNHQVS